MRDSAPVAGLRIIFFMERLVSCEVLSEAGVRLTPAICRAQHRSGDIYVKKNGLHVVAYATTCR